MKNSIEINKLCAYVIGAVVFLIQPCQSINYLYLNHTNIILQNGGNINSLSFSFRTCSTGVLFREEKNNFTISIIAGNETKHSFLRLSWEKNNSLRELDLKKYISIDTNVGIMVKIVTQTNNTIFAITNFDVVPEEEYSMPASSLDNLTLSGNFTLGSDTFTGCFSSGTNINIDRVDTCSLGNLQPCDPRPACPRGFTGRYCQTNIDECASSALKCHSFSKCVDKIDGFICNCGPQWNGTYCKNFKGDLCVSTPCENQGTCTLTEDKNNYTCTCLPNTSGRNCEYVNYCLTSPCQNDGSCYGNSTGFTCQCIPGTSGVYCEIKAQPCAKFPCNGGQCNDLGDGNFTCNCSNTGLYGEECQHNTNQCLVNNPCKYNATCQDKWGLYVCHCIKGYNGRDCDNDIDDCLSDPCDGKGNCTDDVDGFECKCNPGYNGSRCENNIKECIPNPCHPTQSEECEDGINAYVCRCKPGYNGSKCETLINECDIHPCENNAQCVDLLASYQCLCVPGFRGINCSTNINECASTPCKHGTCADGINEYTCTCEAGYIGNDCETNEDNCDPNPCLHNGACKDKVDNYTCECIPSYIARNCTIYRDPCAPANPCQNGGTCSDDALKGFTCACGNEFDGDTCQHKFGVCYPNPCLHGTCIDKGNNTYNCSCNTGYMGRNCTMNVKECDSNPCKNGGICEDGIGKFTCRCPSDRLQPNCEQFIPVCGIYKWQHSEDYCKYGICNELGNLQKNCSCTPGYDGVRCENDIDECALGYCENNSNCTHLVNDYNCTCVPGYMNKNCNVEKNECEPDPCEYEGNCTDKLNDFECKCKFGYEGKNCSLDINWCAHAPCQNGGRCLDRVETYNCTCLAGFSGRNCSNDINECSPNPCVYHDVNNNTQHESVCVEKSNKTAMSQHGSYMNISTFENRDGYICHCLDGLNGTNCSINIENCTSTTCDNNATCTDWIDDFHCQCHAGYNGKRCKIDINECGPNPCENNATCMDLVNDYNCTCHPNFAGRNCDVILSNCSEHYPCQSSSTTSCHFNGSDYNCTCAPGFTGHLCTDETNINLNGIGYWKLPAEDLNRTDVFTLSLFLATTLRTGRILYVSFVNGTSLEAYIENSFVVILYPGRSDKLSAEGHDQQFNNGRFHDISLQVEDVADVYIGGAPGESQMLNYTGCIQDVKIGDKILVPSSGMVGSVVNGSCSRTPLCNETSCSHGNGSCIDNWLTSECDCKTQYFGDYCESEMSSFSFGNVAQVDQNRTHHSRRRRSSPIFLPTSYAFSNVTGTFDEESKFSFRIRTRQRNNLVAVLVNRDNSSSYLALYLNNGKLTFKTTGLAFPSQGVLLPTVLNDGVWHEIFLSTRSVSDNGNENGTSLPSFNVSRIYFGGVDTSVYPDSTIYSDVIFDGCLQAVKLKNTVLTSQSVGGHTSSNTTTSGDVKFGCPSNNPCEPNSPCLFGNCTDRWFAYSCSCRSGFFGRTCSEYGCAVANSSHPCRNKLNCVDVPKQPGNTTCSTSFTFNGVNSSASIKLENITVERVSFALQTRQHEAFLFASYESSTRYFVVGIKNGNLSLHANYSGTVVSLQGTTSVSDGDRHDIELTKNVDGNTSLTDNNKNETFTENILSVHWLDLLSNSTLVLALDDSAFIRNLFRWSYFGAFTLKQVGEQVPVESDFTLTAVKDGWHSSNPCRQSPCAHGNCTDTFNDYNCTCPSFYTKKDCNETVDIDCSFEGSLCKNGSCETINGTMATMATNMSAQETFSNNGKDFFKCMCFPGYTGLLCGDNTDECTPNPCAHNATCADTHRDYVCDCSAGWTGTNCTLDVDECDPNPCKNRGTCINLVNDYECRCFEGRYKGKNCTLDVDECNEVANPCNNSGNCTNKLDGYNCTCNNGSFGDKCQYNNIEYCAIASPCNHGTCEPEGITFICRCNSSYTGMRCDQDFDECGINPCEHGGACAQTPLIGPEHGIGYTCACLDRYQGFNCSDEKDPCQPNPCLNGNCTSEGYPNFKCDCDPGFAPPICGAQRSAGKRDSTTVIVVIVVVVVVVIIIAIILFICYYRKNSGREGTYNPHVEENKGGVEKEMDEIKKPKVERLI